MNIYTLDVILISGPVAEKFIKKNPAVTRTIAIRGDQTLEDLHHAIFKAFDRFDEHMYEFQIGGKGPDDPKAKRYGLSGLDNLTGDVARTTFDALRLEKDEIFGYWFDFGDDWWHQVNVDAIEQKNENHKYPRVIKRVGKSPPQYEDVD
jgi:hypothetical protein